MSYEFGGSLFSTDTAAIRASVYLWLTAGGRSPVPDTDPSELAEELLTAMQYGDWQVPFLDDPAARLPAIIEHIQSEELA